MLTVRPVLMIIGLVFLLAAAFNVQAPRVNLMALGLAFWLLAMVLV